MRYTWFTQHNGYHNYALLSGCKKQNNESLTMFMASVHTHFKCSGESVQITILSAQSDFTIIQDCTLFAL